MNGTESCIVIVTVLAGMKNAPVCIQVVGRRLQGEKLVKTAKTIESSMPKTCSVGKRTVLLGGTSNTHPPMQEGSEKPTALSTMSELDIETAVAA